MTIHINRAISEVYAVQPGTDRTQPETDGRLKDKNEHRRIASEDEADRQRVAAWCFDD